MDTQPSENINLPFLTLFVPAYNRAYSLGKTLESVERITSRDFEVIIVDDGSIDNTREIVDSWSGRVSFPIRYFYQENSGKAGAHNSALKLARGVLFMTLDAGDLILPDAVERIRAEWQAIPKGGMKIAGIGALCLNENGEITGKHYPEGGVVANYLEMITYTGEKRQAILTSVMRQYPYPQIPGEKHLRPSLILKRMAHDYRLLFVNIPVQVNVREKDGITANIRKYRMDNPGGFRLYYLEEIVRGLLEVHQVFPACRNRITDPDDGGSKPFYVVPGCSQGYIHVGHGQPPQTIPVKSKKQLRFPQPESGLYGAVAIFIY